MDLTVSEDNTLFFKQIWTILGIRSIPKSDLIYKISYKLNLPYKPTTLVKKIKDAVAQGILIEKDKLLRLNEKDQLEINRELRNYKNKDKKNKQDLWSRIEESNDPWMDIVKDKTKSMDKKSLTLNTIVRKIMTDDAQKQGTGITASKFHTTIENNVITGTIDDDIEENLMFQIDLGKKTILHNCKEYIGNLAEKPLCKHFYRIFMYVKKKDIILAKNLLLSLYSKKEEWIFKKS